MRAPSERAPRRIQHLDKWFFLACFAGGFAVIFLVDRTDGSKWIAVWTCVAIMAAYAFGALRVPGLKLRADQAADNLYYLGLLYTLTSLGVALIRFTESNQATDAILRNFGIAIFTTIVGLGFRVFVGQFREDPEDLEQEARQALTDTVRRMRRELDVSVAELRSFADGMRQVVGEFTEKANTSTVEALERAAGQFESAAGRMGTRFENSAAEFGGRIESFEASLERVVGALEGLMGRIGAVRADADVLERGIRPALDAMETAVAGFAQSVTREQARFEEGAAAIGRLGQAAEGLRGAGEDMAAASQELRSAAGATDEVTALIRRLEAATSGAADSAARFSGHMDELAAGAATQQARSIEELQRAVTEAAERAADEARGRLEALEAAGRRVVDTFNRLDKEFAGSGVAIVQVRRELAELAGWIIARLER